MRVGLRAMWSWRFSKDPGVGATTLQTCCATWSRRFTTPHRMNISLDNEGLMASFTELTFRGKYSTDAGTRSSRAKRGFRCTLVLLCICLCHIVLLWRRILVAPQPPVRGTGEPTLLHDVGVPSFFHASCAWVPLLLVAYHQRFLCVTTRKWWPFGLGGVQTQRYSNALCLNGLWFVVAAAALVTSPVTGEAPGPTSTQLGKRKVHGIHLFASERDVKNRLVFDHVYQTLAAPDERDGACGDFPKTGGQPLSSDVSNGSTVVFSRAAEGGRRQRVGTVDTIGSERVYGHLSERSGSFKPNVPSAPYVENGILNHSRCGAVKLSHKAKGESGAASRVLRSVVSPEEHQEKRSVLEGKRVTCSGGEQRAEPTMEEPLTDRAGVPTEVVNLGIADEHSAHARENLLGYEAERRYSEGNTEIYRGTGALAGAEEHSTLNSERVMPGRTFSSQHLSRRSQNATDMLPYVGNSNTSALSATSEAANRRCQRPKVAVEPRASSLPETAGRKKEQQRHPTKLTNFTIVSRGSDNGGSPPENPWWGKRTEDAEDSLNNQAPAEVEAPKARSIKPEPDTKSGVRRFNEQERLDPISHPRAYGDRFYRAKDTPKTYSDSDDSAGASVAWEVGGGPSLGPSREYREPWLPDADQGEGTDAQDRSETREFSAEGEMLEEVDWTDPESMARAEAFLRHQMRALERQVSILEDQLKGIEADVEVYRAGIEGVNPKQNADTFEKLVHGGQSSSQQMLLEKLQTASESLDSRVKMYVRTNTTFYANQLNDIVQVRLAPLRQGVLDLSLSLMDAASSTIDITRQLSEAASHVNATTAREAAQMEALRARREAAFTEALEEEEIAMQGQLVASKQREQSRVNKSSVEEQILLSAIEGAVDDMKQRGFAVLDFSAVYPESEARKVLDLTLYFADLQTRPHGWEVLPIVVVPSSGFVGHIDIPQTASEWLTSVLGSADGTLPTTTGNPAASVVSHRSAAGAAHKDTWKKPTNYAHVSKGAKSTLPSLNKLRRDPREVIEDETTTADESTLSADVDSALAGDGVIRTSPQKQHGIHRRPGKIQVYKRGATSRWTDTAKRGERHGVGTTVTLLGKGKATDSAQVDTSNNLAGVPADGDTPKGHPSTSKLLATQVERGPAVARVSAPAEELDNGEQRGAYRTQQRYGAAGLRRLGGLEESSQRYFSRVKFPQRKVAAAGACSGTLRNKGGLGTHGSSSQPNSMESRRLAVLEGARSGRHNRAIRHGRTRRVLRNKTVQIPSQQRTAQTGIVQLFSAPQFILGGSYPEEDQVETGRKWLAAVLRKTQAVVASWWGEARHLRGEALESRGRRSILPPTYTLQHLVREHFETLRTKPKGSGVSSWERESHFKASESVHHATGGSAAQGSVNAPSSASNTGAAGATSSQPTTQPGQNKDDFEQTRVFGSRLGYYVLRAEQILLEGFYVAPEGEVSSVLLRYPHLKDLGPLVPSSKYGIQLLRQLITSFHAKVQLQKGCTVEYDAIAPVRSSQVFGEDEQELIHGRAHQAKRVGQAQGPTLLTKARRTARPEQTVTKQRERVPENVLRCTPATYNPFLRCMSGQRLSGVVHADPSSAARATETGEAAEFGRRLSTSTTTEQDQSHVGASRDNAGAVRGNVRLLQDRSDLRETASGRAACKRHTTWHGIPEVWDFVKTFGHRGRLGRGVNTSDPAAIPDSHPVMLSVAALYNEHEKRRTNDRACRTSRSDPTSANASVPLPAGRNCDGRGEVQSSPLHTVPQASWAKNALRDAEEVEEKLLKRKVLIIHLGPRSDGLPLAYPDGAEGKELQRQRLVRHSLIELLASSRQTDLCTEDCGSCLASVDGTWTPEPQQQKAHEEKKDPSPSASGKGGGSATGPEESMRDAGVQSAEKEANVHKTSTDKQWPARFGQLDAVRADDLNAVTLAKTLQDVNLESAVRKQLLALQQELRLASPTRWAADGAVVEKYLENHQVEISVAWGRPPPALHLPLTPFFTHNILLIRVETEKCPKKYGDNSYSVPPNSVLEHALYLLAHPVAGLAAIAAFHFGKNTEKSLLERLRKAREHLGVTASGIAKHAANFWGRATGASMQTFWIAHIRVKAPGHPGGSTIELLDGRLNAEAGSFVPLSSAQKSEGRFRFPAEVEAWGWRYAVPLKPDEGPFLQGRLAGYGEAATTCKPVEALVQSAAANLQTRVIPQMFVSSLRGRSVVLALSSTEAPFKGEQLVSKADLEAEWHAGASSRKRP